MRCSLSGSRSTVTGFPAVTGNKLEWALTAKSIQADVSTHQHELRTGSAAMKAAREAPGVGGALLVTGEMEVGNEGRRTLPADISRHFDQVAGVYCRLKFFPDGSPLRQEPGFCSVGLSWDVSVACTIFFSKLVGLYLVCTVANVNVRCAPLCKNCRNLFAGVARFRLFAGTKYSPVLEATDWCLLESLLHEHPVLVASGCRLLLPLAGQYRTRRSRSGKAGHSEL